jgi:hypothetical protein
VYSVLSQVGAVAASSFIYEGVHLVSEPFLAKCSACEVSLSVSVGKCQSVSVGVSQHLFLFYLIPFGSADLCSSMSGRRCILSRIVSRRPLYTNWERSRGASLSATPFGEDKQDAIYLYYMLLCTLQSKGFHKQFPQV